MNSFTRLFIRAGIIFIVLFSKFSFNAYPQGAPEDKIPNVIIVTFNGVRNEDSIDDPTHQYIPNFWNNMRKEGVLYTNLTNLNFEFHMPSVNAINTGGIYPFFSDGISAPTIFQYVKKKYALQRHKLWLIGHWFAKQGGLTTAEYPDDTYPCQMSFSIVKCFLVPVELTETLTKQESIFLDQAYKLKDKNLTYFHWDTLGEIQYRFFKKIVQKYKPKLIHYVMNDVESAHYDSFARYVLALKRSDEKIFEILQMIKSDPFYKNNTYLFISMDHGRNLYYMNHTENPVEDLSRVWMYVYGPDIKKGITITRPVRHIDIFATVADIMAVETYPTEGKVLKDSFNGKKVFSR